MLRIPGESLNVMSYTCKSKPKQPNDFPTEKSSSFSTHSLGLSTISKAQDNNHREIEGRCHSLKVSQFRTDQLRGLQQHDIDIDVLCINKF